jgi:basic amino acid/polyamine antiporter, APA family
LRLYERRFAMRLLARRLRLVDYSTLGFGVMVGTAWLVVMDDILRRGGPLGAVLGFTVGALALLPVGYVYGRLVMAIPDAAGEVAYTARFFPVSVSFVTGWMMILTYFLTCPFEALAAGRILGYMFPSLNRIEMYRLGGQPVYLPHFVLGLAITAAFTWLNYRGIEASARFLKWTTFVFLVLVMAFAATGVKRGSASNLQPLFSHSTWISILLVWQVVPWLMSGFEAIGKCAEEADPKFRGTDFSVAISVAILGGMVFYWVVILAVAFVAPWQSLDSSQQFPTAAAFQRALHANWIVDLVLASALVSLTRAFNANMIAASRLLFAMGRRNLLEPRMARVHAANRIPSVAVIAVGIATALALLLGEAGLVPILEVGAVAAAIGWMAACASYYRMKPPFWGRCAAVLGLGITALMILVKIVPAIPGHFSAYEWIALALWAALGILARASRNRREQPVTGQPQVETVVADTPR